MISHALSLVYPEISVQNEKQIVQRNRITQTKRQKCTKRNINAKVKMKESVHFMFLFEVHYLL
jgi:hypothetical protein